MRLVQLQKAYRASRHPYRFISLERPHPLQHCNIAPAIFEFELNALTNSNRQNSLKTPRRSLSPHTHTSPQHPSALSPCANQSQR